jgi:hypothetical protein
MEKFKLEKKEIEDIVDEFSIDSFLGGYEDEDRDNLRDFMCFMREELDKERHFESYNEEIDEVEYYKRVYKYYVWDVIWNHHLIGLLINDREGRLEKPLSEMKLKEFMDILNKQTTYDYNNRVLGKQHLKKNNAKDKYDFVDFLENIEEYSNPLYEKIEFNSQF